MPYPWLWGGHWFLSNYRVRKNSEQTWSLTNLRTTGRQIKRMKPDGNCYFQNISHQLFTNEQKHYIVRSTLIRFENLNKSILSGYLTGNNEATIDEKMDRASVWATQVEVHATSSFFQIPVYMLCYTSPTEFHWEVIKPINKERLQFPLLVDCIEDFPQPTTHWHTLS